MRGQPSRGGTIGLGQGVQPSDRFKRLMSVEDAVCGSPQPPLMTTPLPSAAWRRWTRCWWPFTRGTSTAPAGRAWRPLGSTVTGAPYPDYFRAPDLRASSLTDLALLFR